MENRKRSIAKMLTYRVLLIVVLGIISWIFTSDITKTTIITVAYSITATTAYYVHERLWNKTDWNIEKK